MGRNWLILTCALGVLSLAGGVAATGQIAAEPVRATGSKAQANKQIKPTPPSGNPRPAMYRHRSGQGRRRMQYPMRSRSLSALTGRRSRTSAGRQ